MKALIVALVFAFSAQAHAWNKIVECNNGELVVDEQWDPNMRRMDHQLVLRGGPLQYFVQQGAVPSNAINEKGELVLSLSPYDSELFGSTGGETGEDGMSKYRTIRVSRSYDQVMLRATFGNRYQGESELANWKFYGCR